MCDIREARQKYSDTKLQTILKVLHQLDDPEDETSVYKLCRKSGLSEEKLKLHHRYADHFRKDWGTYAEVCDALTKECRSSLKNFMICELHRIGKEKEPSIRLIRYLATKAEKCDWIDNNDISNTIASQMRLKLRGKINRSNMKTGRCKNFLSYSDWVETHLQEQGKISYKLAKRKHREIIGEIKIP